MKLRSRILMTSVALALLLGGDLVMRPPTTSFGQQNYPEPNRKPACGCYACGLLLAVNFPGMSPPKCFGIVATDACPVEMEKLPSEARSAFCKQIKKQSKDGSLDACLILRGACQGMGNDDDGKPPEPKCEKPTPWFDRSTPCTDVQAPVIAKTSGAVTLTMCGLQVFRWTPPDNDPLVLDAYRQVLEGWVRSRVGDKICCSSMRKASRAGDPCNPGFDIDCDGNPNHSDVINDPTPGVLLPDINFYTNTQGADVDPFPPGLDPNDPNFRPERTGRNSKGVGECPCKWQLIKGDMKCSAGIRPHVYTATWQCPSTKAEVFTTKKFPGSSPCSEQRASLVERPSFIDLVSPHLRGFSEPFIGGE